MIITLKDYKTTSLMKSMMMYFHYYYLLTNECTQFNRYLDNIRLKCEEPNRSSYQLMQTSDRCHAQDNSMGNISGIMNNDALSLIIQWIESISILPCICQDSTVLNYISKYCLPSQDFSEYNFTPEEIHSSYAKSK